MYRLLLFLLLFVSCTAPGVLAGDFCVTDRLDVATSSFKSIEVPRDYGCTEHPYERIELTSDVSTDALFKALVTWEELGHSMQSDAGYGTLRFRVDPEYLDLAGRVIGLPEGARLLGYAGQENGNTDCTVTLRTGDDWTLIAHEIGHCLCYNHTEGGPRRHLMASDYAPGEPILRGLQLKKNPEPER